MFFGDDDYQAYLDLVAARPSGTEIWAYCLMPNHVVVTVWAYLNYAMSP